MSHFKRHLQSAAASRPLNLHNYKITYEPLGEVDPLLAEKLPRLQAHAIKGKPGIIESLRKYIKKYPTEPVLKNYLFIAYQVKGKKEEVLRVLEQTLKLHPDYLFAKCGLAEVYLEKEEYDKVPEILGEEMDLGMLYPDRDTFHFTEALAFFAVAGIYDLAVGAEDRAKQRLELLQKIDKEDERTLLLEKQMMMHRIKHGMDLMKKDRDQTIEVDSFPTVQLEATEQPPVLQNDVLRAFYQYAPDADFPNELIDQIKGLERESLIADLELILEDSIRRWDWYQKNFETWKEDQQSFQVHAFYWLAMLDARDSLPAILNLLRQGDGFLDYWFATELFGYLQETMYLLGESQLPLLKQFALEPNLSYWARMCASSVVEQVVHHQPARRAEAIEWFREVLQYHLDHPENKKIIDSQFITWTVDYAMNCNATELIPIIEQLWEKGWIHAYIIGDLDEIKKELNKPAGPWHKDPLPENIEEFYTRVFLDRKIERIYTAEEKEKMLNKDFDTGLLSGLFGNELKREEDFPNMTRKTTATDSKGTASAGPKIGRNAPCPCGSGKKYKKCCL